MNATARATRVAGLVLIAGGLSLVPEGSGDVPVEGSEEAASQEHAADPDCLRCHEPIRKEIEAEVPHEPAFDEDCSLCHSPHASRYEKMLNVRERALCFTCHRDQSLAFMTGTVHTPIREGQCVVCHEVHGSEHASLLVAEGNELCMSCHEDKHRATQMATVHEPFADGECTDCHGAHNAAHDNLLVGPANSLCALCHDASEAELLEAHYDIPIEGTRCNSCHDAHASESDGLLLPVAHEPFADGSCEMCHLVDTPTPRLLRATGGRLCQVCHRDYPRSNDSVVHAPVAEGNCSACHDPHASANGRLLSAPRKELCLDCHVEIDQRAQASKSAHPFHFDDGGDCNACHQPHSSREDDLLLAGGVRTCLVCHETQRHGHPLGDDRLDPRTGKAITCVTCHDPHGTDFSYQLRGDQSRGLCIQCHDSDSDDGGSRRR